MPYIKHSYLAISCLIVLLMGCSDRIAPGNFIIITSNNSNISGLYSLIDTKLNITDQRYNDTYWIKLNYYNKSFIDNLTMNGTVTKLYVDNQDKLYNDSQRDWVLNNFQFTNGSGINLTGLTFSHWDTSSVSNSSNTGTIVIQNLYFDEFGHVTGFDNKTIASGVTQTYVDNRDLYYYNKSANYTITYTDSNFYNKSYIDDLVNTTTYWVLNGTVLHPRDNYSISTENYNNTFGFRLYVNGSAYIRTLNVSNSTIYLGTTRLSASNQTLIINDGYGNVSAKYYLGSAKYLTDIDFNTSSQTFIDYNNSVWYGIWSVDNRTTIVNNTMIFLTDDLYLNKLNITDQRYNDTAMIRAVNSSINQTTYWLRNGTVIYPRNTYTISTENRNSTYGYKMYINGTAYIHTLNVSGETINLGEATISATGGSLKFTGGFANVTADYYYGSGKYLRDLNVSLKLNITDQRYNETWMIRNETIGRINNDTYIINLINQVNGTTIDFTNRINALNLSKLDKTDQRYNDTLLIYIEQNGRINNDTYLKGLIDAINISTNTSGLSARIDMLNLTKLDKTDQRYNETTYINNQLLNYYNITEINELLSTYYNITEIDSMLDLKLNVTDQRYNETAYINNLFLNYYNSSQIDSFLDLKLNISDQRYNDTLMIQSVNTSLRLLIDTKLNITDQRYNDTALILLVNNSINLSGIYSLIDTKLNITDQRYNETYLFYALNASKLDKTDQRYNDTTVILQINNTVNLRIDALNFTKLDKTDQRYNETLKIMAVNLSLDYERQGRINNDSYLDNRITLVNNTMQFINSTLNLRITQLNMTLLSLIDTKLNITDQRYNETYLFYALNASKLDKTDQRYNDTVLILSVNSSLYYDLNNEINGRINNDSYLDNRITVVNNSFGVFEEYVNITVTGGDGYGTTTCCSGMVEILQIKVSPLTSTNKYRFYANTSITGEVIDSDRTLHTGIWEIAHRGSVVNNENINYYITNALIDEQFSVRVRYQR